jgi:endoglucanase
MKLIQSIKKNQMKILSIIFLMSYMFIGNACNEKQSIEKETIVDHYGALSIVGNQLVDKNGEVITLRGMSLFWSQIKGKYYNYDCVKWLRDDWKCTLVRAALGVEMADSIDGYLVNKEQEYNKVITVIDAAIDLGIYVIVDWHDHHAERNEEEAINFFEKDSC